MSGPTVALLDFPDGEDRDTPLRRSSSQLMRAASSTFTGGATVIPPTPYSTAPPNGDDSTRRAHALRRASRSTVQQRMMEELWSRYQIRISLFICTLVLFSFTMIGLFYNALYAVLIYNRLPCDEPLKFYLVTSFVVGQITPQIVKKIQQMQWAQGPHITVAISMAGSIPGWIVIAWGFIMVNSCKTCQQTNPDLYYPTKHFILGQVVLFVLTTIFFSVGFTGVLAYWSTIADSLRPGCEAAVHKLPKVLPDSPELKDVEDGESMECSICTEEFASTSKAVVRTPCGHLFHEACLARWCQSHLDCPLCRACVGEATPGGRHNDCSP